ncbi:MAG: hypothetical protein ABW208_03830 [Pyrinomonadaceae bacterium]
MTDDVNNSDLLLRRYLLGGLAPGEREQIEQRVFIDPLYREKVQLIEEELVDEFVDGNLTGEERAAFAAHLRVNPSLRLDVGIVEELKRHTAPRPAAAGVAEFAPSRWAVWLAALRRFRTPLAVTCLALLVGGAALLFWRNLETRRLEQQLLYERARRDGIEREVARLNAHEGEAGAGAALEAMASPATRAELAPGVSRDARDGAAYPTLAPPPGAAYARLRLRLEPAAGGYQIYLARFKTVDNGVRFEADLRPTLEDGAPGLWVTLPLGVLPDGDYQIELSGRDAAGRLVELPEHYYSFRIIRRRP